MSTVGEREAKTQRRVTEFFLNTLGYVYLGFWKDRAGNSNVEEELLHAWLTRQGHRPNVIRRTLHKLEQAKALGGGGKTLYDANREVYGLLRYGVKVSPEAGEQNITVWLIDWANPGNNDFAVAEEVAVSGEHAKRPDLVLYVNGIAVGVLELKRSIVSVTEGIRQNLDSQKKDFIRSFFSTVQFVMAGNETEGLRYGVIGTPEKHFLRWKEQESLPPAGDSPLLRELGQVCRKDRLLELVHDFIVFDAGTKKTCRHNQYFGVKAAQERVRRREGGIIWHTQGSGKSLTMVWLAKWIREHVTDARVLLITDRRELDEQIEKVFKGVNEAIYRTRSASDLGSVLNRSDEWLIGSLVHKFGQSEESDFDGYIEDVESHLPKGFRAKGDIFVFVDECHRTQSGKLHRAMKAILPGAMFVGFTGTPLLKKDKQKSIEIFGSYIHTYKYDEAVGDGVVLDLRYEARDIDQSITAPERIDQWFEIKTKGLSDLARAQLKKRWGTMQKVLSAQDRLEKIVADVVLDMETRDRLQSGRGNAMLVADSIYSACRFYDLFENTALKGKTKVVSSYRPAASDPKGEETGEGTTEKVFQYDTYRRMLAEHFEEPADNAMHKVDQFEQDVKRRFIEEPGQVKLLIVVDKLLTGFDAPPATYLYIDKEMRDHGLFQAICRVNRLDTHDKEYGYIVDYKDLFKSLEQSIHDYTGGAFDGFDEEDVKGLLENRLEKGRERLEGLREKIKALCEPVEPPWDTAAYLRYFCAASNDDPRELKGNEPKRVALYDTTACLVRAYANLANEMEEAGYGETEIAEIKAEVEHFEKVREEVKLASGDYIDLKLYEPAMRHLLDTYIRAEESERLSAFGDKTLVDLIITRGEKALEALPEGIRSDDDAMGETIENNVRKIILDEMSVNPKYYERMSELLDALIRSRKQKAMDYKAYLARMIALANQVKRTDENTGYPPSINSPARQALYDNLGQDEGLAVELDTTVQATKKDGWRGNRFKEKEIYNAVREVAEKYGADDAEDILQIVRNQREY